MATEVIPTMFTSASTWSIALVRAALDEHETGSFQTSSILADAMGRDADIFSGLLTRVAALSSRNGLPFSLSPAEGVDDRRAAAISRVLGIVWWLIVPETEHAAMERDAVMLGAAVGRDVRVRIDGKWFPRLRRYRPSGLFYASYEERWHYIDGAGTDHVVTPGENGWVLHTPVGGDAWMHGAVRALGIPWAAATHSSRDWARYNEKHGLAALKILEPFNASDEVEGSEGKVSADRFYTSVRKLGSEPLIRCPQPQSKEERGWDAEWMGLPNGDQWRSFERQLIELRRRFNTVLLGRDAESSAKSVGGDGAAFLERVRSEYLIASTEAWSTTLREQLLKPWLVREVDAQRPELAPYPRWDTTPRADLAQRASTIDKAADATAKLDKLGVDVDPFLSEMGLRRVRKPEPTAPAAPPNPPQEKQAA